MLRWLMAAVVLFLAMSRAFAISIPELSLDGVDLCTTQKLVRLDGNWLFIPGQLLSLVSRKESDLPQGRLLPVPGAWDNRTPFDEAPLPGHGFGTYALRVVLPPQPCHRLALLVNNQSTAWEIEITTPQGERLSETFAAGKPGTDAETSLPFYRTHIVPFTWAPQVVVVARVSNFHHANGGLWNPVRLGTQQAVESQDRLFVMGKLAEWGFILCVTCAAWILFLVFHDVRLTLPFACLGTMLGIRLLVTNDLLGRLANLPSLWLTMVRTDFFCATAISLSYFIYARNFTDSLRPRFLATTIMAIHVAFLVAFAVLPFAVFYKGTLALYLVMGATLVTGLVFATRAALRLRTLPNIAFLVTTLLLIVFTAIEIGFALSKEDSPIRTEESFVLVLLAQAISLFMRERAMHDAVKRQAQELLTAKEELERKTQSLATALHSIEDFNLRLQSVVKYTHEMTSCLDENAVVELGIRAIGQTLKIENAISGARFVIHGRTGRHAPDQARERASAQVHDGVLEFFACEGSHCMAEIAVPLPEGKALSFEEAQYLDMISLSLASILINLEHVKAERDHLVAALRVAASVSDKVNSPLMGALEYSERIARHLKNVVEKNGTAGDLERLITYSDGLTRTLQSLRRISHELEDFREDTRALVEPTKLLSGS